MASPLTAADALALSSYMPCIDRSTDDHDLWLLYEDPDRLALAAQLLVEPFRDLGITRIVGKESRGFLLGGVCAVELGVGFVAARKYGGYMPGAKETRTAMPDWEGKTPEFSILRRSLGSGDRVLVVDDWYTTGNQCRAVKEIVESLGAQFVGASVLVEEDENNFRDLGRFSALLRWNVQVGQYSTSPHSLLPGSREPRCSTLGNEPDPAEA